MAAIPEEADCLALLKKYSTPDHIVRHCQMVWEVGQFIGKSLIKENHRLDIPLLRASCLLHDIGKFTCIVSGEKHHDIVGQEILIQEGLPDVGLIVAQHVVLGGPKNRPVAEEHVVFYADKRVMHDKIVSLESRFVYLNETYGKTPEALNRLSIMKQETMDIEKAIFEILKFGPEQISEINIKHN
ncbi:MAG: HD domain-containing protein [Desulfomonilaceae bacterium]